MVKVGDKTRERCEALRNSMTGVVVYVHPEKRFYVVEFQIGDRKFRESFTGVTYEK